MGKSERRKTIGILLIIATIVIAIVIAVINLGAGDATGDVTITGGDSMTGLKCTDTALIHPVFTDIQSTSHTNTITANFIDNSLSSIMYKYDGIYQSEDKAANARVLAEADYNLILANDYDAKIDIFSHTFMTEGTKISLTISDSANKVTSRTAPYFLLDASTNFPKTLEELQAAYETKGFSCTVNNKDN